jgi:hypothetical protein
MEAITGAAILIDKARLVRGQATSINANVLIDLVRAVRAEQAGGTLGGTLDGSVVK